MPNATVVLLHPGEMGAAVGRCLKAAGHRVLWVAEGRGAETRARAEAASLEAVAALADATRAASVVLSVCPPHGARELAAAVAATGFRGTYVDANAIAPQSSRAVAETVAAAGARFVDGGIVGPPPLRAGSTRLYLSGAGAGDVAALFAGTDVGAVVLAGAATAASALKMCYAGWNKGAIALLDDMRALAAAEGVEAALLEEWALSMPEMAKRSDAAAGAAHKAWRWVAEMEEIAATCAAAGLPDGFHKGAAEVFARLDGFKGARATTVADVVAALRRNGAG